jgi:hypothetical protein
VLEDLKCVFESRGPAVVFEDETLQALHDVLIKTSIAAHSVVEGYMGVIYI